jgi:hypothetical protein
VAEAVEPGSEPWLRFAFEAERLGAVVYATLARAIHTDGEIRALAAHAQPLQPHPNLLFGAVHYLLLRGKADGAIRRYYRTLGGEQPVDGGLWPAFREFCMAHADALVPIIASRITNTNEVGRSAILHPGFHALARRAPEPLHLIEIGPSAGINMLWDRFGYRYVHGADVLASGVPNAPLILESELRGVHIPALGPSPRVAMRVGLERNPVDLSREENRDWLRALVWSDHRARLERLERALAVVAGEHADIRAGSALDLLPGVLSEMPSGGTVCVYHTIVTYQFSEEDRAALDAQLMEGGRHRDIWRLSVEGTPDLIFPLTLDRYRAGDKTSHVLAHCNAHGGWLEWLGSPGG